MNNSHVSYVRRIAFTVLVAIVTLNTNAMGQTATFDFEVNSVSSDSGNCISIGDVGQVTIEFDPSTTAEPDPDPDPSFPIVFFDTGVNSLSISIGDCFQSTTAVSAESGFALVDFLPGDGVNGDTFSVITANFGLIGSTPIDSLNPPAQLSELTKIANDPNTDFFGDFFDDNAAFSFNSVVPEPSSGLLMMGSVIVGCAVRRRRRRIE